MDVQTYINTLNIDQVTNEINAILASPPENCVLAPMPITPQPSPLTKNIYISKNSMGEPLCSNRHFLLERRLWCLQNNINST
jgi:hypothetical protein